MIRLATTLSFGAGLVGAVLFTFAIVRVPTHGFAELVTVRSLSGFVEAVKNLRFDTAEDAETCAKYLADKSWVREADSLKGVGYGVIPWPESVFITYEVPQTRSSACGTQRERPVARLRWHGRWASRVKHWRM